MNAPKRVLYAEDEYTNRRLIEIRLNQAGVECDLAENGVQALELFRRNRYALVILDNYMPGLMGDQVARMIRKENSTIPIIAITSDDEEIANLLESGCNDVLIKPLKGAAYMHRILTYLEDDPE